MNSQERHERRYQRRKAAREAKREERLHRYDNFDGVASPSALMRAHFESRSGKQWKTPVAKYNRKYLRKSKQQSDDLYSGKNTDPGFFKFKVNERGKTRNVNSARYPARVVRRSLCTNALVPILSNNLIYDNSASLKGKGVDFALNRCETHLHRFYRRYGSNEGYAVMVDFTGYFDHIRQDVLINDVILKSIKDSRLTALSIFFIDATNKEKPPEERGIGLFIGPEDSQIYAVAYPNRIDHKVKDQWRTKEYGRYMDDCHMFFPTKEEAHRRLNDFYEECSKIGIILNLKKTQIVKLSHGFTYLKTKFYLTETGKVVRKPVHDNVVRERRKLKKFKRFYLEGVMTLEKVQQSYMSWRGSMLKRDSYNSVKGMDRLFYELFGACPVTKTSKKKRGKKHNG